MAGSGKVHALGSPRDTALRSIPELKQFMRKNQAIFEQMILAWEYIGHTQQQPTN